MAYPFGWKSQLVRQFIDDLIERFGVAEVQLPGRVTYPDGTKITERYLKRVVEGRTRIAGVPGDAEAVTPNFARSTCVQLGIEPTEYNEALHLLSIEELLALGDDEGEEDSSPVN